MITGKQIEGLKAKDICFVRRVHLSPDLEDSMFIHDGIQKSRIGSHFSVGSIMGFGLKYGKIFEECEDIYPEELVEFSKQTSITIPKPNLLRYGGIHLLPFQAELYVGDDVPENLIKFGHGLYVPVFEQIKNKISGISWKGDYLKELSKGLR
jgi:hypothetical protein